MSADHDVSAGGDEFAWLPADRIKRLGGLLEEGPNPIYPPPHPPVGNVWPVVKLDVRMGCREIQLAGFIEPCEERLEALDVRRHGWDYRRSVLSRRRGT